MLGRRVQAGGRVDVVGAEVVLVVVVGWGHRGDRPAGGGGSAEPVGEHDQRGDGDGIAPAEQDERPAASGPDGKQPAGPADHRPQQHRGNQAERGHQDLTWAQDPGQQRPEDGDEGDPLPSRSADAVAAHVGQQPQLLPDKGQTGKESQQARRGTPPVCRGRSLAVAGWDRVERGGVQVGEGHAGLLRRGSSIRLGRYGLLPTKSEYILFDT